MSKLPRIIGLTGSAGVGKDTLADLLVREHGYVKLSLADPIKELLNQAFGWSMADWENREWKEGLNVASWGPNLAGRGAYSPRFLAQWLGTEVGRYLAGPDVWLNAMWAKYHELNAVLDAEHWAPLVVPDVRFDNEADFIRDKGGVIVRVTRMGAKPVAAHVSEKGLTKPADLTVENFGATVAEFEEHARLSLGLLRAAA